ncbi:hypothetical protein [Paenibacillus alkalitolerans]|uniref:hypothetical protein n=1 Tax=Paenibacillus alkalitolerans TaxID=2799335 RepID=UPI0018F3E807|nr:hypothetical protein [Paenibacillus alkalitolerans]
MKKRNKAYVKGFFPFSPGQYGTSLPGQFLNQAFQGLRSPGTTGSSNPAGGAGDIDSLLGGLDGMISTMGKLQKLMSMVKQMRPMFEMLNSLGPVQSSARSLQQPDALTRSTVHGKTRHNNSKTKNRRR